MIDQYQMLGNQGKEQEEWIDEASQRQKAQLISDKEIDQTETQQPVDEDGKQPLSQIESLTHKVNQILQAQIVESVCIDNQNVLLAAYLGKKMQVPGRLKVTNIKMSFYVTEQHEEQLYFQIPLGYLLRADRFEDKASSYVQVFTKYGVSVRIKYFDLKQDLSAKSQRLITHLIQTANQMPLEYGVKTPLELKCQLFCPTRCEQIAEAHWYENEKWMRLVNYPQKFRVPLPYLSRMGTDERLIVLSFVYHNGREEVTVWRTGPGRSDHSEQEWMNRARSNPKLYTIEIKNKGIGSARSLATKVIELQNLAQLRQSFFATFRLAANNYQSVNWISQLMSTKWYQQIGLLLQEASCLVNQLIGCSANVTILADTDIRGAQLTALCQVLLFPQCRSVNGFGELVERQFLQWGGGRGAYKKQLQPDRGTAFIQFLDAVYQLTAIYPLSFEFSQGFLLFLAEQVYSNRFGNFLLLSRVIKQEQREIVLKCACVWRTLSSWISSSDLSGYYMNPFYVDYRQCDIYELKQMPSLKQMRIWSGFFFKKFRESNYDYHLFHRYNELNAEHFNNKKITEQLRRQLSAQHKLLQERRALLNDLKQFE